MRNRWGLILILASVVITAYFRGTLGVDLNDAASFEEYAIEVCPDIRQMFYHQRQELYQSQFEACMKHPNPVNFCSSYIQHNIMPDAMRADSYYLEKMGCGNKL